MITVTIHHYFDMCTIFSLKVNGNYGLLPKVGEHISTNIKGTSDRVFRVTRVVHHFYDHGQLSISLYVEEI